MKRPARTLSRKLVAFFEGQQRVEVTDESLAEIHSVYVEDAEERADARAAQSRAIAQLSPDAYDCPEHRWMAPRRFDGEPRLPASMVKVRCPDCRREAEERAVEPHVVQENFGDLHWHDERVAIVKNPKVEAWYAANLERNAKPGQPPPGSKEEAEALQQMDDARHDVSWRDKTAEERRRASRRYWRTASLADLGLPSRYGRTRSIPADVGNARENVNAIHASRAW
jgi:hypothetical protein